MGKVTVNEDLQKERDRCDFNTEELTNFLDGGAKFTSYRRNHENAILSVKEFRDEVPDEYLSHKEKYENAVRKDVLYHTTLKKLGKFDQVGPVQHVRQVHRDLVSTAIFKENSPMFIHFSMFVPAIIGLGTEEQKEYWLNRAKKMEIIGSYAQTELGHGTNIRALETTATYDPDTEEFVLNSPTLTSHKWWPGGLGHTVNFAVVMAQLVIKGKKYGIQPFIVQLRDLDTHMPLPGIKIGEIGAKFSFNPVNNGFLGFTNYRIPRNSMLMKNAQVLKDGTFKSSANSKLTYGTMVFVRVTILNNMANLLAKAVTIAVRYSAVRKQSQLKPNEPEPQILDYLTQQHKLFAAVASSYAFTVTAIWLWNIYVNVVDDLASGNTERLPELHALSCCLKAVSTADASSMVERCRLACGGHGYMLGSNLPLVYTLATAAATYEGENTVLMLQTARYLVKAWERAANGEALSPTTAYLSDKSAPSQWDSSIDGLIKSFQRVASRKLAASVNNLKKYIGSGLSPEDAWNMTSVQLVATSEAHCRVVIVSTFKTEVDKIASTLSAPVKRVLYQLVELYAVYWALEKLGDMLLYTSLTENDAQELQRKYEDLLRKIRPNAVGIVDAFDFRDEILNSTLGAYDGRVYERMMEQALKSPLNAEPVNQSFHKYLKPFMQGKL